MDSVSGTHEPGNGTAVLERFVDPVVAVTDGVITFANGAARTEFGFPAESLPREPESVLGAYWSRIEDALTETTVGTARHVSLETAAYDARVHRGAEGATIVFEPPEDQDPPASDRSVKDRAINEAPVGITISDPSREDNPLVYINEAYEEITGYDYEDVVGRNCRLLQGEDSDPDAVAEMRAGIEEERPVTVEIVNYRKDDTRFWNEVTIAPVRNDAGELTHYVGFQNDVTARKEAELELERRTEELEYILERIEGLIQDVTDVVAGSTSRRELEAVVCERIVTEEAYEGAWIGERDPATERIEVRERAGVSLDASSIDDDHPAAVALESHAVAVDGDGETTRASFPLRYNGIDYGVLTVRTDCGRTIDDRESVILSALARTIASGVNARETSRTLATDAVVAVDVDLTDPALAPVALSAATDARFEYRRSVHRTGDGTASLFTVEGTTAEALRTAAAELPAVSLEVLVEHEGSCLVELHDEDDPVGWLSDRGVRTISIESEDGSARLSLEIPRSANVRSVVEAIEDRYDGTDVVSFHQREGEGRSRQEFASRLEESLTDRQFTALQRAYLAGYFEWPRPTTGEELARTMDVSRPTFHEHLRGAEAKLCRAFFGDD
ncbi:bacterio-opsin activator domain-containing protein [Natronococcus occultus]|uniref:PAS domain S-box n=1 Tax=Natronococcus occultus SP4 TaxID=694430 RepID=L0JTP7_9EURY|nr:bacterio-opsin activator domain-containing protein [Natronococcus occultus]AGB36352.1 PAS domain S-box [Natronococcus occultus SP4]